MDQTPANPSKKRRRRLFVVALVLLLLIVPPTIDARLRSQRLQSEIVRLQKRGIAAVVVGRPTRNRLLREVPYLRNFLGTDQIAVYLPSAEAAWTLYLMPRIEGLFSIGYTSEKNIDEIIPMLRRQYTVLSISGEYRNEAQWVRTALKL
jgi:hypothetical protein